MDKSEAANRIQEPIRPKRRWHQYSLRTFIVLVSLVAVGLGIWVARARNQQRAVKSLTALGARVIYEHQWPSWAGLPGAVRSEQAEPLGPDWLRKWLGEGEIGSMPRFSKDFRRDRS